MIKLEDVVKEYGNFKLDVSINVEKGTIVGLIGSNGSGKTTTFKAILNLIKTQYKTLSINGIEVDKQSTEQLQNIVAILSDTFLCEWLKVKDIASVYQKTYQKFDASLFFEKCKSFGVDDNKLIKDLSTGNKTKVKIIAAIACKSDILILDEPTLGLDVIARDDVLDLLRNYMQEDLTRCILISSHIASDLECLCDNLYFINDGHIVLKEETHELLANYGLLKMSVDDYQTIDKQYILKIKKETYGYRCLTNQRQYYVDNYPLITIENGGIDDVLFMVVKGDSVC